MARESVDFYRSFHERLSCSVEPRLEPCGYLFLAHSAGAHERLAAGVRLQNALGISSRLLTPEDTAALVEGLDPASVTGAAFCAEDGYFDKPQAVVEGFAEAAQARGVEIVPGDVTALRRDGAGWRLDLADGRHVLAEHVVVAAGYDSPGIVAGLGLELPIRKEPRYLFLSPPIQERVLEPLLVSVERRFAAKQLASGRVLASDLGAEGGPERRETRWRDHVRACISELVPRLEFVSFPLLVEGFYDLTPDRQAILGPVGGLPGLWLAAGFSGHGFMMAPAVGRAIASAVVRDAHEPWLDVLGLSRFARGRLVVEPQIV
jgi:sarcosine oxidase subunit beta